MEFKEALRKMINPTNEELKEKIKKKKLKLELAKLNKEITDNTPSLLNNIGKSNNTRRRII